MKHLRYVQLAMALDCEGYFTIRRNYFKPKSYYRYWSYIGVSNTNSRLVDFFRHHFGGTVYKMARPNKKHKERYEWRFPLGNKSGEELLLSVLPYLILKNEQAQTVLEFIRLSLNSNKECPQERARLWFKMKDLNRRGATPEINTSGNSQNELKIESELAGDRESASVVTQTA